MAKHQFLSPGWIKEARKIRDRHKALVPTDLPAALGVKMNVIVVEVPFGDEDIDAHVDSSGGGLSLDVGHIETPDVTITVDYAVAKELFVDQNIQAAMQAFLSGRIRVQGDMTKLFALQAGATEVPGGPAGAMTAAKNIADELAAITAP